jgi:hypothetical protein
MVDIWVDSERQRIRNMIHPLLGGLSREECNNLFNGLADLRAEMMKNPHLAKDVLIMGLTISADA